MIAARVVNRCSSFSRKSPHLTKRAAAMLGVCLMVVGLPAAAHAQSEAVEYYGLDALGSVRVVFDANGNLLGRMDYGPFGEALVPSTGKQQNIYAGLFADGEAELDHADARSYQVRTGRFSTVDPLYGDSSDPQGWNRYAYALNNPIPFSDPTGLLPRLRSIGPNCDPREFICIPDSYSWTLFGGADNGRSDGDGPLRRLPQTPPPTVPPPSGPPPTAPSGPPPAPPKSKVCSLIPEGRTTGFSGSIGGVQR